MRFFEHKLALILLVIASPLLFLPKINLINVGSETAGLRIDDLVLLIIGTCLMLSHALSHKKLYKIEGWILALTTVSLFSFFSNYWLVSLDILPLNAKIFYAVRLLEYFIFFYIGGLVYQYFDGPLFIRAFFIWNFLLMALQKMGLAGALTVEGYSSNVSERVQGVASFPSEMGLLLNLLFCWMIYDDDNRSRFVNLFASPLVRSFLNKSYLYLMFVIFGVFIVFTGNRISILALLFCFVFRLKKEFSFRCVSSLFLLSMIVPVVLTGIILLISKTASVYERSSGLFSFRNFQLIAVVWDNIDMEKDPVENQSIDSARYDISWWLRIHKWIYVMKSYAYHPICYLQGLGPGYAWTALDGGWLRIFVEYGIVGAILYFKFFLSIYRINPQTKWMMIAFGINMIFFDAYLAYKTMSFLLLTSGYAFEKKLRSLPAPDEMAKLEIPLGSSRRFAI